MAQCGAADKVSYGIELVMGMHRSPSKEKRYRVLHVITRLVHGGAQENTLLTAHRMRAGGFDPILIIGQTDGPEGDLINLASELEIPVHVIPELVRDPDPIKDVRALFKLITFISETDVDLVHTHTSKAGFLGRIASRFAKAPAVVHTPHGHIFHDYYGYLKTALYIMLERLGALYSDRILTLSRQEAVDHLQLGIGQQPDYIHVPSGVDFARFDADLSDRAAYRARLSLPSDAFVAGSVGRLAPVKGHKYLFEAFALLHEALPDLYVLLAGDGELRQELEECASKLGILDRVVFAGLVKAIPRLLPVIDVAVFPSLNEGMGRAIAEAMYCRLPVIATQVGGVPELLDYGNAGLLVPPHSASAIARSLEALYNDPELRNRYGAHAYKFVMKDYSLDEMIRRIEKVYLNLLQRA